MSKEIHPTQYTQETNKRSTTEEKNPKTPTIEENTHTIKSDIMKLIETGSEGFKILKDIVDKIYQRMELHEHKFTKKAA